MELNLCSVSIKQQTEKNNVISMPKIHTRELLFDRRGERSLDDSVSTWSFLGSVTSTLVRQNSKVQLSHAKLNLKCTCRFSYSHGSQKERREKGEGGAFRSRQYSPLDVVL